MRNVARDMVDEWLRLRIDGRAVTQPHPHDRKAWPSAPIRPTRYPLGFEHLPPGGPMMHLASRQVQRAYDRLLAKGTLMRNNNTGELRYRKENV